MRGWEARGRAESAATCHLYERALEHHAADMVRDVAGDDVEGEGLQPLQRADGDGEDEVEQHCLAEALDTQGARAVD